MTGIGPVSVTAAESAVTVHAKLRTLYVMVLVRKGDSEEEAERMFDAETSRLRSAAASIERSFYP